MKTEQKKITGKAFLTGDETSTKNLIAGIMLLIPEDRKEDAQKLLETKLIASFEETHDIEVPETLDEAVDMLPNGRESMTKMVITKAITNQMDKIRLDIVKRIVKSADIASVIAKATLGK